MNYVKPCPFCGEGVRLDFGTYGSIAWVECQSCHARGPMACRVSEEFVKQWNKVSSSVRDGKMEDAVSRCSDEPDHIRRHDAMVELGDLVMKKLRENSKGGFEFPAGKDGQIYKDGQGWIDVDEVEK